MSDELETGGATGAEIASQVAELRKWLGSYVRDVEAIRGAMVDESLDAEARQILAGALIYQVKQLDLVPDWVPGVGMADDAMVLRVAAARFVEEVGGELPLELLQSVSRLGNEAERVREILGELYPAFEAEVLRLRETKTQGNRASTIVQHEPTREHFLRDLKASLAQYRPATLEGDAESFHRKLMSYLRSKLK